MHWVVIPFRGVESAKSRLAEGLSDEARRQVANALFQHVLAVASRVAGPRHVLVVTPSVSAMKTARRAGVSTLRDLVPGHNEALQQACAHLRARGAATAAIVAADLPLLKPINIEVLQRCARSGIVAIAPDREGHGTNAIALPLAMPFHFRFGARSRYEHQSHARELEVANRLVQLEGLLSDLDTASDLALLDDPSALSTLPVIAGSTYRGLR